MSGGLPCEWNGEIGPSLVILSRGGRASIDADRLTELEERAHVTVLQRERAPGRAEAIELLAEADLLGSTNICLPTVLGGSGGHTIRAFARLRGGRRRGGPGR